MVEELCLTTLGRQPSDLLKATFKKELARAGNREEAYRDLFWALLNSKEFSFNH